MLCLLYLFPMSVSAAQEFKFVSEFGGKGEGDAQFAKALFMAFGPDGAIYVTDTDNFRIQKFDDTGVFAFDIQMEEKSEFRFINPTDIAIGTDNAIYVMDWMFMEISDTDLQHSSEPKIFNYGPCVHKFDAQGAFVATSPIQDFSKRIAPLEAASPGLDADGNYALVILQGDTKRNFLLTVDTHGNLYVCDTGPNKRIFKLDVNGMPVARYPLAQPGTGHLIDPVDITVDKTGNLYIVDEQGHRVLKYSTEGEFLDAFGEYGDGAGQFIKPSRIAVLEDGTLLVADTAKYLKDFVSTLPTRLDDPTRRYTDEYSSVSLPPTTDSTIYHRWRSVPKNYLFRSKEKLKPTSHYNSKGLITLEISTISIQRNCGFGSMLLTQSLISPMFQTELKLRYTRDLQDVEIDNQDDLDADLYTKSDFDEQIIQDAANANLIFSYDISEAYRLALSNRLTFIRATDTSYYRSRDFEDFRGRFNQDDRTTETSWDDRVQFDFTWIRDHSLYNYREARAYVYFSVIRVDFINDALDRFNARFFDFNANLSDWEQAYITT